MKTNNTIEKQIQETYKITNQIKKISIEDKNTIKCTQILLIDKFVKNKKIKLKMIEEIGMNTNIIKEYGQEQMKKGMEKGREEEREKT